MIVEMYRKTHEATKNTIKKAQKLIAEQNKNIKIITLGDILKLYPNGRIFLNDSDGKPIYDFNMNNPNILFQNLDKEVEKIEIAMFPDSGTHRSEFCLAIKLR